MRPPGTYIDPAALERAIMPLVDKLIDECMADGVEAAQDYVPVDTGELHDGIEVITPAQDGEGEYGVNTVEHALHVEFGTVKMAAQPYLRPSIDAMQPRLR